MKEWTKPDVSELDVKNTAGGRNPSTTENNMGYNTSYDAVNYERVQLGQFTTIIEKGQGKTKS